MRITTAIVACWVVAVVTTFFFLLRHVGDVLRTNRGGLFFCDSTSPPNFEMYQRRHTSYMY